MASTNPSTTTIPLNPNPRTTSINGRQTYWCHECDMSFSLLILSPSHLICPHCHGDFCEEMDSPLFSPSQNPNFPSQSLTPATDLEVDDDGDDDDDFESFQLPSTIRISDAYLLDRLIQHLTDPDDDVGGGGGAGAAAASKACVESIPTVRITKMLLDDDVMICAVCKDEFLIDVEAKQLPCNHMYHSECIMPWLSQRNSCPVCRFTLPTDVMNERSVVGSRNAVRYGNLLEEEEDDEEEDDVFAVGGTLRQIVRRHRLVFAARSAAAAAAALGSSSSPTQMAQVDMSSSGPANSGETVSSRPFELGSSRVSSGIGSGRLDEDGDTVMSEVRRLLE